MEFIKSQYRVWDYRFFLYIRKNQERDSETDGDGSTCDSHLFLSDAELRYAVWNGKRVYGRSL